MREYVHDALDRLRAHELQSAVALSRVSEPVDAQLRPEVVRKGRQQRVLRQRFFGPLRPLSQFYTGELPLVGQQAGAWSTHEQIPRYAQLSRSPCPSGRLRVSLQLGRCGSTMARRPHHADREGDLPSLLLGHLAGEVGHCSWQQRHMRVFDVNLNRISARQPKRYCAIRPISRHCILRQPPRPTHLPDGTHVAGRRGRLAQSGAQLHQRLVEAGRVRSGHQLRRRLPAELLQARAQLQLNREEAREDSHDVAVDKGLRLAKCYRRNRASCIGPNAWDAQQIRQGPRHRPSEVGLYLLGALEQHLAAPVVAQARPQLVHFIRSCRREGRHGWERCHPAVPIGNHRLDAGLLQHNLADPRAIGTRGNVGRISSPWKLAPVSCVPCQQRLLDVLHVRTR
mmetsp:Transcript_8479/g.18618  ORF Transcript_8479/g.18618 Transcript_8479/m.18618 type:complete len:397 (+) Transcript_8479:2094-3284(+)